VLFSTVGGKILTAFEKSSDDPAFQAALTDPKVLADPTNNSVVEALKSGGGLPAGSLDDTSFLARLDPRLAKPFLEGFSGAMDLVFAVAALVVLVALVVVFFLPEEPLRKLSGLQARQQEAADTAAAAAAASAPSSQMVDGDLIEEQRDEDELREEQRPQAAARP
jgi:hypothetical protein